MDFKDQVVRVCLLIVSTLAFMVGTAYLSLNIASHAGVQNFWLQVLISTVLWWVVGHPLYMAVKTTLFKKE